MLPKRRKPTHPGKILQEYFLFPLQWTPRQFAEKLGGHWTEVKVEAIIQGKENLSEEATIAFARVLDMSPSFWHQLQSLYNQWEQLHSHSKQLLKKAQ